MNIAYLAPSKIPSREANSVHVMKICNAFAAHGHGVTLLVPDTAKSEPGVGDVFEYYGVPESFVLRKSGRRFSRFSKFERLSYVFGALRYIRKNGFDCVYGRDLFACYAAALFCKKPVYFEVHTSFPGKAGGFVFHSLLRAKRFKKIVVITEALKQYFVSKYGLDGDLVFVAPDGADALPESVPCADLAERSAGKFHVGFIGSLYKGRGMELLGDLAERCPFAFFHIVGGTERDIAYWSQLYGALENVHFYGYVPPSKTAGYGMQMDALIAPYQDAIHTAVGFREGEQTANWMSPLKIFEYMALGKPIVSSNQPVLREVLTDGVNGLLCPPSDVPAWSAAISKLHEDSSLANALGERALAEFEKYTWKARAGNILEHVLGDKVPVPLSFFALPDKHVFFGYYDLPQIDASGRRMLVHVVDKNADPSKDAAEIGCFELDGGVTKEPSPCHLFASTRAWCWQQGARLRWHPLEQNTALYNDVDGGRYVTKSVDISDSGASGEPRVIAPALYDFSCDFRYGVSVNFARLQRLRPGYGYCPLPDLTAGERAPEDDGVFLVDLREGTSKLVVSLRELALENDKGLAYEHYINHVSFCPSGSKFMFFHVAENLAAEGLAGRLLRRVARRRIKPRRVIRLFAYDIESERLTLLEDDWMTSHYCWRSDDELLTTSSKDGATVYAIYDLAAGTRKVIEHESLRRDGHPSFIKGGSAFVSDTYPDGRNMQKLFVYDIERGEARVLAELHHEPARSKDMRCDLHPRVWDGGSGGTHTITLDTTHKGGVRSVAVCVNSSKL